MDSRIARFPGSGGGPEWAGGAMDEKRGLFIINTHDMGSIEMVEQKKEGHWGSADGPDSFFIDEEKKLICTHGTALAVWFKKEERWYNSISQGKWGEERVRVRYEEDGSGRYLSLVSPDEHLIRLGTIAQ